MVTDVAVGEGMEITGGKRSAMHIHMHNQSEKSRDPIIRVIAMSTAKVECKLIDHCKIILDYTIESNTRLVGMVILNRLVLITTYCSS